MSADETNISAPKAHQIVIINQTRKVDEFFRVGFLAALGACFGIMGVIGLVSLVNNFLSWLFA